MLWSVHDGNGTLLLREGAIIAGEAQLERLSARGLFRLESPDPVTQPTEKSVDSVQKTKLTVLDWVNWIIKRQTGLYTRLLKSPDAANVDEIIDLAREIQNACDVEPNGVLTAIQLKTDGNYSLLHPLHSAIISEQLSKRSDMSREDRLSLITGAIVHDLGMFSIQNTLQHQKQPLTEDQWKAVRAHPSEGCKILEKNGVTDEITLGVVMQHHERIDGSGYPAGKKGSELYPYSRIMSISDIYSAMVRPRSYREPILATEALKKLFMERGATIDNDLCQTFIKELGVFPTGAIVKVNNGAIAVIVGHDENAASPIVASVYTPGGVLLTHAKVHNVNEPGYKIEKMVSAVEYKSVMHSLTSLWQSIEVSLTNTP